MMRRQMLIASYLKCCVWLQVCQCLSCCHDEFPSCRQRSLKSSLWRTDQEEKLQASSSVHYMAGKWRLSQTARYTVTIIMHTIMICTTALYHNISCLPCFTIFSSYTHAQFDNSDVNKFCLSQFSRMKFLEQKYPLCVIYLFHLHITLFSCCWSRSVPPQVFIRTGLAHEGTMVYMPSITWFYLLKCQIVDMFGCSLPVCAVKFDWLVSIDTKISRMHSSLIKTECVCVSVWQVLMVLHVCTFVILPVYTSCSVMSTMDSRLKIIRNLLNSCRYEHAIVFQLIFYSLYQ